MKDRIQRTCGRVSNMLRQRRMNPVALLFKVLRLLLKERYNFVEIHDNELDCRDKDYEDSFLNWKKQKIYLDLLNPRKYYSLARNKFLTHVLLDRLGIEDKARLLAYYSPESGVGGNGIAVDYKGVSRLLKESGAKEIVAKTTESSHGDNVVVIKDIDFKADGDALLICFDGKVLKLSELCGKTPLIFETVIRQSAQMMSFNPSSVNTVRFMTNLMPDGTARTIASFIKIGRAGRCVDNAGGGGNVDAAIDVVTGRLYNAIQFNGWRNIEKIEKHPDTGARIEGVIIKNWEEIRKKVESFQQQIPFVKAAGWDIAITDAGPVIVEVNDMWDRTGQLFLGKGWKIEIKECYEEWRKYYATK